MDISENLSAHPDDKFRLIERRVVFIQKPGDFWGDDSKRNARKMGELTVGNDAREELQILFVIRAGALPARSRAEENLICLGTLDSNGCSYRATCGVMRIMKGALVVMKGLKQNGLDLLQCSTVTGAATTSSSSDIDSHTTKLWHMHLGHMSERGIDVLSKQGPLESKKTGKLDFCEHCVFGKQWRVKFSRAVHITKVMGGLYPLKSLGFLIRGDVTFDESSILSKKEKLIHARKDHDVREKMRKMVLILPKRMKNLRNSSIVFRREIQPPQKYGYADMVTYALSVVENIEVEELVTYKEAIKST
ncbi:hypothetical protein RJ639_016884 [Escallonia herrerae]|uniref:GAG-pre-integrase domain-containing protein n=1 Tax=Escallonia herrerae TaxID=1293975 RepID=A0AA88VFR0_9ASTE|nr:hypothetical protein RJ639_016884 [Escallonia herrerae]